MGTRAIVMARVADRAAQILREYGHTAEVSEADTTAKRLGLVALDTSGGDGDIAAALHQESEEWERLHPHK